MSIYDEESNVLIREYMEKYKDKHNKFVLISKSIPKYKPNQLSNCWHNYLNPLLCLDPLTDEEKNFIIKEANNNRMKDGKISWKKVVSLLKDKYGLLRSENKVRNFWNSKKKSDERRTKREFLLHRKRKKFSDEDQAILPVLEPNVSFNDRVLPIMEPKVSSNDFNMPYKMVPLF
ncbi:hypothetical protein RclHR1_18080002 [Rhizophagus clarus]|uniref:Myb-like domain-containing protein n=1 Tax=Rhizophagus clarus TaxID=94130 RepID=A0A2Z6QQR7_9GLOM|nr:hypothetical protein RclHR1_18080002 [Rhizophagus clarus]GES79576.1 hypothetical protein GLOIN_2v1876604 [Rhizophagus clarus]